ncbi:MAG TPA: STAS domain-containing protein [Nocardioidaceae bacterium]|nr:STAS domain-containing protein [Nocardioidaceae bacterium]
MTSSCEVQVRQEPGAAVLSLSGEVDGSAAGPLTAAYGQAVRTGDGLRVILDFADVDYINSTGIALIVSVLAKARAEGRSVVASCLTDHYRHIFDITRLSDFIQLYTDTADALAEAHANFSG